MTAHSESERSLSLHILVCYSLPEDGLGVHLGKMTLQLAGHGLANHALYTYKLAPSEGHLLWLTGRFAKVRHIAP